MSLDEIRERVENAPRLLVSPVNEGGYEHPASVYEEEDGLETLAVIPNYYFASTQNALAQAIVDAYEDRARLLAALDAMLDYGNQEEIAEEAVKNWKPREY